MDKTEALLTGIADYQAELRAVEAVANQLKARIKECKAEVARLRALEAAKKRAQSKPEYAAVLERKEVAKARLAEAVSMRRAGLTFPEIAAAWSMSVSQATQIVKKAERIELYRASHP